MENCFVVFPVIAGLSEMAKAFLAAVLASAYLSLAFSEPQRRVFHGQEAEKNEFPYMVNVRPYLVRCGGVLLSNQYVLTAAHCLMDAVPGRNITLVLGSRNFYGHEPNAVVFKESVKFWLHENFSMPSAVNDLAIIQLPRPVDFSEQIKPIRVSTDKGIGEDRRAVAALTIGFGKTEGNFRSTTLQKATMKLIPISECLKYQPHFIETVTEHHICAFGVGTREGHGVGPCDGDSGKQSLFSLAEVQSVVVAQDRRWCSPGRDN